MVAGRAVEPEEVDPGLATDVLVERVRQVLRGHGAVRRPARHLGAGDRRVVDDIDEIVHLVLLVGCGPDLRPSTHQRVARDAGGSRVAAIATDTAPGAPGGTADVHGAG